MLSGILKLPLRRIDTQTDLAEYGIDSLIVNRFNAAMEETLGSLPKTLLFENRTLDDLATYLADAYASALADFFSLNKTDESAHHASRITHHTSSSAQRPAGFVPGEGVGAVLLRPLDQAIRNRDRIYGVIRSTAINHGGKALGYYVPNPDAHAAVVTEAIERAGVNPETISYVEAHGTGTELGDPVEIRALHIKTPVLLHRLCQIEHRASGIRGRHCGADKDTPTDDA